MPGLIWSSLKVVAADGLVGKRGVALRTPILQDEEGRVFLPSGVENETVEPRQVLSDVEYRGLLDGGVWIRVRDLVAKRGHVLVLRSASFAGVCRTVGLREDLHWEDRRQDIDIAYVNRASAVRWRAYCAERFVPWAENRIREHLSFDFPPSLTKAHVVLEQALFVTDVGSPARQRVFVLLGILLAELSPSSWPMLAATAIVESPGLDQDRLNEEIEAARHDLKARSVIPRKSATWARGYEQCSQPPGL